MNELKQTLKEIGYRGYMPKCLFSDEEVGLMLAEETNEDIFMEREKENWEKSRPKNTAQGFIDDGTLTKEQSYEMRRKYLYEQYREASIAYHEELLCGSISEETKKQRNRVRFLYEIYTIKTFNPKGVSEQEIERAGERSIGEFIKLNARGFALCSFHTEKTPSLKADKNLFYCFGCGAKGDTITFIMKQNNYSFKQAIKFLQ